jgi:hypothetical protein
MNVIPFDPRMPGCVVGPYVKRSDVAVEARRLALNEAKRRLQAKGLRWMHMEPREIAQIARAIFEECRPGLMERACENLLRRDPA